MFGVKNIGVVAATFREGASARGMRKEEGAEIMRAQVIAQIGWLRQMQSQRLEDMYVSLRSHTQWNLQGLAVLSDKQRGLEPLTITGL